MENYGTWALRTERLLLRQFRIEDTSAMFRNWAASPEVSKYLSWCPHKDTNVTHGVLTEWIAGYVNDDFYQWAIVLKELGEPIGSISFHHIDESTATAEMGCCIGQTWWRGGIATEATRAIMKFGFEKVGFEKVRAWHAEPNIGSRRTLEKLGLEPVGEAPQLIKGKQVPGTWLEITSERFAELYS